MKLSFLPGKLFLESADDGSVHVTLNGEEIFCTRSRRAGRDQVQRVAAGNGAPLPAAGAFR